MLLSKEVEVRLSGGNAKYYENLGYEIPKHKTSNNIMSYKYGTKIIVKVEDLPKGSGMLVEVKCDCKECQNPYLKPMKYNVYNKCVKEDGNYYCNPCSKKLYGSKNLSLALLKKKGESFEDWCIKNDRQDILLDLWDYNLNKCLPSEISSGTNKKYYFKCPKELHESELKIISNITKGCKGTLECNKCNSFAQYLLDTFGNTGIKDYWDYDKNTLNPWEISYGSHKKVWIKCQEKDYHGSYSIWCNDFSKGNRCPYCNSFASHKVHYLDSLGYLFPEVLNIWSDKNEKSVFDYAPNSNQKVWWKCIDGKHEDYKRTIDCSKRFNYRCPECSRERDESFLQEKVRLYLEETKYTILHENKCNIIPINPKTNYPLPFDNEIKELKLICEVNGIQHYEISTWYKDLAKKHNTTPEYELHYQQLKDRYKRIKAIQQKYYYLEIPYWTEDDESYKTLIDNKIKEILNNKINMISEEVLAI